MFLSYTYTQPYFKYIEELAYNVIPGTITLVFDSPPSTNPADYQMVASQGILNETQLFGFSTLDGTLVFSGETVTITVPVTMDSNAYMQFFYQGNVLPFIILCAQDFTYETPAIFKGKAYTPS